MAVGKRQPALARAADAMARALGGSTVTLRIPVATTGGTLRELGVAPSAFQEVEVGPVVVRALSDAESKHRVELLIAASTLDGVMPGFGATDGRAFLEGVQQVVYANQVFAVTEVSEDRFAGVAYMYHVTAGANGR